MTILIVEHIVSDNGTLTGCCVEYGRGKWRRHSQQIMHDPRVIDVYLGRAMLTTDIDTYYGDLLCGDFS